MNIAKSEIKILDCTIRDGGYYNKWNFSDKFSKSYFKVANNTGINIVEAGYKSLNQMGTFKSCTTKKIESLIPDSIDYEIAFMVDIKEFIKDGKFDKPSFKNLIKNSSTVFSICRVAITENQIDFLSSALPILEEENLKPMINLMKTAYVEENDKQRLFKISKKLNPEAIYIADSFGSMTPSSISKEVNNFCKNYHTVGVHTHDNLGLAFANSIAAIQSGAKIIDTTFYGMGRGVGNAKTEQALMYFDGKSLTDNVVNFLESSMLPLHENFKWGYGLEYMYCGINNIHPMYYQKIAKLRMDKKHKFNILLKIKDSNKKKSFDEEFLNYLVLGSK